MVTLPDRMWRSVSKYRKINLNLKLEQYTKSAWSHRSASKATIPEEWKQIFKGIRFHKWTISKLLWGLFKWPFNVWWKLKLAEKTYSVVLYQEQLGEIFNDNFKALLTWRCHFLNPVIVQATVMADRAISARASEAWRQGDWQRFNWETFLKWRWFITVLEQGRSEKNENINIGCKFVGESLV